MLKLFIKHGKIPMNNKIFNLITEKLDQAFGLAKYNHVRTNLNLQTVIENLPWTPARYRKFRDAVETELDLSCDWSGTVEQIVDQLDRQYLKRFFGEIGLSQVVLDAVRLESWLMDFKHKEELSQRYTQRNGPFRDKKRLDPALTELESLDRIKLVQEGKRKLIKVNPMVLK